MELQENHPSYNHQLTRPARSGPVQLFSIKVSCQHQGQVSTSPVDICLQPFVSFASIGSFVSLLFLQIQSNKKTNNKLACLNMSPFEQEF